MQLDHTRAPLYEAMKEYQLDRVVKFDVPGHKGGRGNKALRDFLGEACMRNDVNSMKPLDNLCHPVSVIKEAQQYAADAFGAENSIFIVNGATGAVQAMVMSVCKAGDKIILPRNVHRSAINALVVCGAIPVYVNPGVNNDLGIPLGMTPEEVEAAILANPDAKAVLVNNPTYYGICSDLRKIVEIVHRHGMKVLVDEAHGTHFYFGDGLPPSAMSCGADMASVSVHKTGGSLTQSAILLLGKGIDPNYVRQIINLTQTTSASYLLMVSLDLARQNLALHGREFYAKTVEFADYARKEINAIGGYYAFGEELCDGKAFYAFDRTKLSVHTRAMGLAGIEVYDLLRDEYDIQIEFGDIGNILAIITGGDRALEIERLLGAGLAIGSMLALVFTFIYFWLRGSIGFEKSFESVPNGFIQMISPILILTFAWTLCGLTRYGMYSADFVVNAMSGAGELAKFLPAVIFIIGAAIGFATGTSWGTIGIMAPIVVQVFDFNTDPILCTIGLAAACSGGVMGDHCSPISDTTIMASAGAHCYHLNHVFTQIPYALTVAGVTFVSFILAGLIQNVVICLIIAAALMIATLLVIKAIMAKKHQGIFQEMAEANKSMAK